MKHKTQILGMFILAFSGPAYADSEAMPIPRITAAKHGTCYFKMMPSKLNHDKSGEVYEKEEAFGIAYKLDHEGSAKEIWKTKGWYAFEVYVSSNCENLVRMGNWSRGVEPEKSDLAVAFYNNGKLIKRYSTADLINNKKSVSRSISHYSWQANDALYPLLKYDNTFQIKTIENKIYVFDVITGEINDTH